MPSRPIQKISGPRLAEARRRLYLSQKQLGDLAGLTESRIGQIEQAPTAGVPLNRVPRLAAALKLTSDEFVRSIGIAASKPQSPRKEMPHSSAHEAHATTEGTPGDRQLIVPLNHRLSAEVTSRATAAGRSPSDYVADLLRDALRRPRCTGKSMKRAAKRMGRTIGKR